MTLPEIAVKRPIATLMVLLSMMVLGIIALFKLELAFMPDAEQKNLFVIADYQNASPKAIERMIVRPIEDSLSSINGLEHMWSNASSRGARINLNFGLDANMDVARAEIHERIDRIRDELPEDLERILINQNWNPRESGETILEARLSSGRDLSKNYDLLDRKIVKPLERIPGVAVVSLDGVNPREVRVNLDLDKLKAYKIDTRKVWQDISRNNKNASLGVVRNSASKITIRSEGAFKNMEEIRNLPLSDTNLRLGDIAKVTYTEPPLEYGRHLDGDFAIGLNIAKESSANTIKITDEVYKSIEKMQSDPELDGINFLVWQDQGKEIRNTLSDLEQTGLFGAILASIVLFIFLRSASATIVAVACIPFSLIVACAVIWIEGKTLNTISLLGLIVGLGMLVDNAVVVMENIDRYQKKGYGRRISAILGSKEVAIAVSTATLTSVIVFLPMIFTKPTQMNLMLQELGITICITIIASLFISQTLIPLAATRFVNKRKGIHRTPIMDAIKTQYERILKFTLRHRWIAIATGIGVLAATWYPVNQINFNFDAAPTEMFVGIQVKVDDAVSLEAKEDIIKKVEAALNPHLEEFNVKSLYAWWSQGFSIVRLYMKEGFQNEEEMNKLRRKLPDLLPVIAGVKLRVQENGPFFRRNSGKRVAIQLQGPDSDTLETLGDEALTYIQSVDGLFDFYSTAEGGQLELHANLDRQRMDNYGVSSNQPAGLVSMTFRGRKLSRFKGEDGEVEMGLYLGEERDTSIEDVKNLIISKPDGSEILLDSISNFETKKNPSRINRQNKTTSIWLGARFDGGKKQEYLKRIKKAVEPMHLPPGYQWQFNNRSRRSEESQDEFVLNLSLALGLIFAVMAGLFESMRQALALMISLPFALAGAFWTLYVFGVDFDQPASIAVLLLLGIVVNNGIVMIEHINLYRREGMDRYPAMIKGGSERLRPIIMTALTTLVGLIPITIQKPALGGVYYYSMAYVIIGGLLFSTLLTTLFLPATIALIEDAGTAIAKFGRWVKKLMSEKLHLASA